jgi:predicted nucleic acid-binding protein
MILDTNAVSALAARDPAILLLLGEAEDLAVSFVSMAEFHFGLLASTQPESGLALLEELAASVPVLFPNPETT